jgi:RNA polymerase sigma-70 factor (ECF subfamily)
LLQRVQACDPNAWQRQVALHTPLVRYWGGQWGVVGADADDLRQDVFQGVATGVGEFRLDRTAGTFRGWLRGITRHKLLDHRCRQRERPVAAGERSAGCRERTRNEEGGQ